MPIRTDTLLSLQAKKWLKKSPGAWLRSSRQEIVPSLPTNILLRPVLAQGSVCKCVEMLDRRRPGCSTRGPWIHHGARTQRDRAERWNSSSRRWCTTCASRKAPHGVPAMTRRQGRVRDIDRNSSHASCARGGLRLPQPNLRTWRRRWYMQHCLHEMASGMNKNEQEAVVRTKFVNRRLPGEVLERVKARLDLCSPLPARSYKTMEYFFLKKCGKGNPKKQP